MSLFQDPHPAHVHGPGPTAAGVNHPVLWFGTEVVDGKIIAIVSNEHGRLVTYPVSEVIADVRHVPDLGVYPAVGREGPGWIDLEDMESRVPAEEMAELDRAKAEVVAELTSASGSEEQETKDYITDREGNKYDRESGRPLDT